MQDKLSESMRVAALALKDQIDASCRQRLAAFSNELLLATIGDMARSGIDGRLVADLNRAPDTVKLTVATLAMQSMANEMARRLNLEGISDDGERS